MQVTTKIIASATIAVLAATSATPAVAYFRSTTAPDYVEHVHDVTEGRRVTSRSIRSNRNQYRITDDRVTKRDPESVVEGGRVLLPVRYVWRRPGLRGERRRMLSRLRGGHYRRARRFAGEMRPNLPPSLVKTGENNHPNWRSWARGRRDGNIRDLNGANRHDYK